MQRRNFLKWIGIGALGFSIEGLAKEVKVNSSNQINDKDELFAQETVIKGSSLKGMVRTVKDLKVLKNVQNGYMYLVEENSVTYIYINGKYIPYLTC